MMGCGTSMSLGHSALAAALLAAAILWQVTWAVTSSPAASSSSWAAVRHRTVDSFSKTTRATTRTQCVVRCQGTEGCESAAFEAGSALCYLQPSHRPRLEGDAGQTLIVYTLVSGCRVSDAPVIPNAHVSHWRVTSSSIEGDVSCDEDYMLSEDHTPLVRCTLNSGGAWTTSMSGSCSQVIWRNSTVKTRPEGEYPLPRTAQVGWAVCLSATPTSDQDFAVDLDASNGDKPLHVGVRLDMPSSKKTTALDYIYGGGWSSNARLLVDQSPPFPFSEGVAFNMTIRAVSAFEFQINVNGEVYGTMAVPSQVRSVAKVTFNLNIQVHYLNVWC